MKSVLKSHMIFLVCAVVFGSYSVYRQVNTLGIQYIEEGYQYQRHVWVLEGTSTDPWQYRVLSEYLAEGVLSVTAKLGVPHPIAVAFIGFRLVQTILVYWLAALFYRKLGLNTAGAIVGQAVLTWAIINSFYNADLSLNTYTDVLLYLLAGLVILNKRYGWIIPITIAAALNRETSGFIPFMVLADVSLRSKDDASKKMILVSAISFLAYAVIFFGLRAIIGPRKLFIPYGNHPGLELFRYNVGREITWDLLFATLSIIPIVAMASIRSWPRTLRMFFWIIVPLWFSIHLFVSVMAETRLFLVPHALIFIPGALLGVQSWRRPIEAAA